MFIILNEILLYLQNNNIELNTSKLDTCTAVVFNVVNGECNIVSGTVSLALINIHSPFNYIKLNFNYCQLLLILIYLPLIVMFDFFYHLILVKFQI